MICVLTKENIVLCQIELAEAEEFDVYTRYAREITSTHSRDALQNLLARQDVSFLIDD